MKKLTLILIVMTFCQISYGQIEIEDKSKEPEIKAVSFPIFWTIQKLNVLQI